MPTHVDFLGIAITTLLGGGLITAAVGVINSRIEHKKYPYEKQSIIADGAEKAVVALGRALDERDARVHELEQQVVDLTRRLADAMKENETLKRVVNRLEDQLRWKR